MQMYRVRFARELPHYVVDIGDCIVCAGSNDDARNLVASILDLPVSSTRFEITRVKPSIYMIGREDKKASLATALGGSTESYNATVATFPGVTENLPDEYWFDVEASARIKAEDENTAIMKLATGIKREMAGENQKGSTRELDIKCGRRDLNPRSPAVEQNALYQQLRFFKGGDTRS